MDTAKPGPSIGLVDMAFKSNDVASWQKYKNTLNLSNNIAQIQLEI